MAWLLDQCPPDYRGYEGWTKNPIALAWLARKHIDGQVVAMRDAWREARVELSEQVTPEALRQIMGQVEVEGIRLRAASRSAALVHEAMSGTVFAPRL